MNSITVCLSIITEALKESNGLDREELIESLFKLLENKGKLNKERKNVLDAKFMDMTKELSRIIVEKGITLDQAIGLVSEKYPEFLSRDKFKYDLNLN